MGKHFGHVKELLRRAETEEPFDTFVAPTSAAPVEAEVTGHVVTPPPTAGSLPTIGTHWRAPSSTPQTSAPKRCPGPSLACGVTACCGSLQNRPGGSSRSTSPSPSSWRWVGLLPHQQFARVALTRLTPPPPPRPQPLWARAGRGRGRAQGTARPSPVCGKRGGTAVQCDEPDPPRLEGACSPGWPRLASP